MRTTGRIAVVGAGIAGAAAASRLARAGHDVVVLDKSRGAGGRTSTRRVDRDRTDGVRFDHGASFLTLREPAERAIGAQLADEGILARWTGTFGTWVDGQVRPADLDPRWVGVPGMSAIARALLGAVPLHSEHRVSSVGTDGVVELTDGRALRFDRVAVAVPAPQAVEVLPPGALREAMAAVEVAPCWALRVVPSHEPEALVAATAAGVRIDDSPVRWLSREHTKPGRAPEPAWVVHATASWSRAHLEASPDEVADRLSAAVEQTFGAGVVQRVEAHRWRFARVTTPVGRPFLTDDGGRLAVCGDGLLGGRVGDALRSGLAVAERWA